MLSRLFMWSGIGALCFTMILFAQTRPSGWVIGVGDVLAWYNGTETQFIYQQTASNEGSIIAAAKTNYTPGYGRADIDQRLALAIHLFCNHDLAYCGQVFADLHLDFAHPIPFGEPAPNPTLPTTPPTVPSPNPLPFGQVPH